MKLWNNKKGNFNMLGGVAVALGVFFIIGALIALVLAQVGSNASVTADSNATYAVNQGKQSLSDLMGWGRILVIIMVFVVILGLFALVGYAGYKVTR